MAMELLLPVEVTDVNCSDSDSYIFVGSPNIMTYSL